MVLIHSNNRTLQHERAVMPKALLKIRQTLSPVSNDLRGIRVLVATPNIAGVGEKPSFEKPFFVTWFGDYCTMEEVLADIPNIRKRLVALGFTHFDVVGE